MEYPYKLSIITINLNNKVGLRKTIESVINQTWKDFEWIIIDGGSLDGSKELIEEYNDYINYWVSEPDKGIFNAMNKGVLAAHGEYLLFLNSGDCLDNRNILTKVIPLLKNKDLYIGNAIINNNFFDFNFSDKKILIKRALQFIPHQSSFIKSDLFKKFGLYNEDLKICGDWEFFFRCIMNNNILSEKIPFLISVNEPNGVSVLNLKQIIKEHALIIKPETGLSEISDFYKENFEILRALKSNKFIFFLFRIYFYFYKKFNNG